MRWLVLFKWITALVLIIVCTLLGNVILASRLTTPAVPYAVGFAAGIVLSVVVRSRVSVPTAPSCPALPVSSFRSCKARQA